MSKTKKSEVKIPIIKKETLVPLEVSGEYYSRLQKFLSLLLGNDIENNIKLLESINKNGAKNEKEFFVETLLALMYSIEDSAKKNNLIEMVDSSKEKELFQS